MGDHREAHLQKMAYAIHIFTDAKTPVIPAKAGIQKPTLRRNAPPFFDLPPFGREKTYWIPAFAGMTGKK
jgi:hypothetical protein